MLEAIGTCCVVHANERNNCQHCWRSSKEATHSGYTNPCNALAPTFSRGQHCWWFHANERNMLDPTTLRVVDKQCYVRLHGPLVVVAKFELLIWGFEVCKEDGLAFHTGISCLGRIRLTLFRNRNKQNKTFVQSYWPQFLPS